MKRIYTNTLKHILSNVPQLQYLGINQGQLTLENPPVKWPCLLIDIPNITFSQHGRGHQKAEAEIIITIANLNNITAFSRSLQSVRMLDEQLSTLAITEAVHQCLQLYTCSGLCTPFLRTQLVKEVGDYEIYTLTYRTAFYVEHKRTYIDAQVDNIHTQVNDKVYPDESEGGGTLIDVPDITDEDLEEPIE